MNSLRIKQLTILIIIAICLLILVACSNDVAKSLRKVTYPPDFTYTEPAQVRSNMDELALQMRLLDQALVPPQDDDELAMERQRNEVLTSLKEMSKIATELSAGNGGSNHPYMQDYLRDFAKKVDRAKVNASFAQPNYYFAGKVSGGCTNCHRVVR
ncbi:hypothetical protein PN836_002920 [Ningiella sp. W23]|uniref:hypothetical protein n=1 Tax=Ningiella sp. W23 TaxID=3023715 RepID=UPI0037582A3A